MVVKCPWGNVTKKFKGLCLTPEEKYYVCWKTSQPGVTVKEFAIKHEINERVIFKWNKLLNEGHVLNSGPGRPFSLSEDRKNEVVLFCEKNLEEGKNLYLI